MENKPVLRVYWNLCQAQEQVARNMQPMILTDTESVETFIAIKKSWEILTHQRQALEDKYPGIAQVANKVFNR